MGHAQMFYDFITDNIPYFCAAVVVLVYNLLSKILHLKRGRFGFDSIDLCRCKHVVRCGISTLI